MTKQALTAELSRLAELVQDYDRQVKPQDLATRLVRAITDQSADPDDLHDLQGAWEQAGAQRAGPEFVGSFVKQARSDFARALAAERIAVQTTLTEHDRSTARALLQLRGLRLVELTAAQGPRIAELENRIQELQRDVRTLTGANDMKDETLHNNRQRIEHLQEEVKAYKLPKGFSAVRMEPNAT